MPTAPGAAILQFFEAYTKLTSGTSFGLSNANSLLQSSSKRDRKWKAGATSVQALAMPEDILWNQKE